LWVNCNPLKELPAHIKNCTNLREIDARETLITKLPKEFAEIKTLISVLLDGCPLNATFEQTFKGMTLQSEKMLTLSMTLK